MCCHRLAFHLLLFRHHLFLFCQHLSDVQHLLLFRSLLLLFPLHLLLFYFHLQHLSLYHQHLLPPCPLRRKLEFRITTFYYLYCPGNSGILLEGITYMIKQKVSFIHFYQKQLQYKFALIDPRVTETSLQPRRPLIPKHFIFDSVYWYNRFWL